MKQITTHTKNLLEDHSKGMGVLLSPSTLLHMRIDKREVLSCAVQVNDPKQPDV